MDKFYDLCSEFWNYTLIELDNHQPLVVKQICIALIVCVAGYIIAKIIRRNLRRALISRARLDAHSRHLIEKIVFYFILVLSIIVAVDIVHLPLTTFAFLGGGLAVGIGFGAKNLFNNLISGIILLVERPVKVGNIVQIEDEIGVIEDIGLRASRICTQNNIHILLPNSDLLENKISNWTMHNNVVLTDISLGLSYGIDADKATEVMIEALADCEFILHKPKPFVLLSDFSDSCLTFKVYFPVKVTTKIERLEKESKVRYLLYRALNEAGIVFAFPQQDMHLDTTSPLEISINNK